MVCGNVWMFFQVAAAPAHTSKELGGGGGVPMAVRHFQCHRICLFCLFCFVNVDRTSLVEFIITKKVGIGTH